MYGETQGQQNQMHFQMDTLRKQISAMRSNTGFAQQGGMHGTGSLPPANSGMVCVCMYVRVYVCMVKHRVCSAGGHARHWHFAACELRYCMHVCVCICMYVWSNTAGGHARHWHFAACSLMHQVALMHNPIHTLNIYIYIYIYVSTITQAQQECTITSDPLQGGYAQHVLLL